MSRRGTSRRAQEWFPSDIADQGWSSVRPGWGHQRHHGYCTFCSHWKSCRFFSCVCFHCWLRTMCPFSQAAGKATLYFCEAVHLLFSRVVLHFVPSSGIQLWVRWSSSGVASDRTYIIPLAIRSLAVPCGQVGAVQASVLSEVSSSELVSWHNVPFITTGMFLAVYLMALNFNQWLEIFTCYQLLWPNRCLE